MALGAVLVDRARRVSKQPTGPRVQGRTPMGEVHGPWFRARLFPARATEATEQQGGKKSTVPQPELIYKPLDSEGNQVGLRPDERLEVDSKQLGRAVWRVVTDPDPMRKRRAVIGYTVQIERVIEREFEPRP